MIRCIHSYKQSVLFLQHVEELFVAVCCAVLHLALESLRLVTYTHDRKNGDSEQRLRLWYQNVKRESTCGRDRIYVSSNPVSLFTMETLHFPFTSGTLLRKWRNAHRGQQVQFAFQRPNYDFCLCSEPHQMLINLLDYVL